MKGPIMRPISTREDLFRRFLADESGATAIEYTLMAAGVAMAIVAAVSALGSTLQTKYESFGTALN
jgi:pilus assembly protein Flp/PilA